MGKMKRSLYEELTEGLEDIRRLREDTANFVYYSEDGEQVILNGWLLHQHNISSENKMLLGKSHCLLKKVKGLMETLDPSKDQEYLRRLWALGDGIEYYQQGLWGFPLDPNYHFFWRFPHCSCPRLDNEDRWGTGYHVVSTDCILHGGLIG